MREGEGKEGGKRLHTVQFLLKDYSYHNCDIVCILHSVTEEGDAEAPNKQLVSSKESPGPGVLMLSPHFLDSLLGDKVATYTYRDGCRSPQMSFFLVSVDITGF